MTEHCSRHHADLIRDLMPQRDLMVGDKVSHPTEGEGIVVKLFKSYVQVETDHGALTLHKKNLTRLYSFSEIWEELPESLTVNKMKTEITIRKLYRITRISYDWFDEVLIKFQDLIPANAAAELLAWVRRVK